MWGECWRWIAGDLIYQNWPLHLVNQKIGDVLFVIYFLLAPPEMNVDLQRNQHIKGLALCNRSCLFQIPDRWKQASESNSNYFSNKYKYSKCFLYLSDYIFILFNFYIQLRLGMFICSIYSIADFQWQGVIIHMLA